MTATLPDGYAIRPVTRDEAGAIAELIAGADVAALGAVDYHADDLAEEWSRPRFDLERDTILVVDANGAAVAYAYTWEKDPGRLVGSWTAIHPDADAATLRPWLLARIETGARERLADAAPGEARLQYAIYAVDDADARMVEAAGFRPVRYFWRMAIALDGPLAPAEPVEGVTVRGFDLAADAAAVHAALEEGFAEHWGSRPEPYDEWRLTRHLDEPDFDARLWFVAEEDGQVAGALIGQRTGDRGWIGELAVRPAWRGRGIGAALLRASFAEFARRGLAEALLSVDADNVTGASRVYERVGMRVKFRFDFYEKPLG